MCPFSASAASWFYKEVELSITNKQLKAIVKQTNYAGPAELNYGDGLIAKISQNTNITFQYRCRFNGKNKRIHIGKYPIITLKKARHIHKKMLFLKNKVRNPKTANAAFSTIYSCLNFCKSKFIINGSELEKIRQQDIGLPFVSGISY